MSFDVQSMFDDGVQKLSSSASTNMIEINTPHNLGASIIYCVVRLTESMTDSGNDSTLSIKLETDDNESFSSPTTLQEIGVFPALSTVYTEPLQVPLVLKKVQKYIRAYYTVSNGNLTTGAVRTYLNPTAEVMQIIPFG